MSIYGDAIEQAREMLCRPGLLARAFEKQATRNAKVVWAAVAQANAVAFERGLESLPGYVVYSEDSWFDHRPIGLIEAAHSIFSLKYRYPKDPELRRMAALVTDEYHRPSKEPIPTRLTDGKQAALTTAMFVRGRMPGGRILSSILPMVLIDDLAVPAPKRCWTKDVVAAISQLDDPRPIYLNESEFEEREWQDVYSGLHLTDAAVKRLLERTSKWPYKGASVRFEDQKHGFEFRLTAIPPKPEETVQDFSGLRVISPTDCQEIKRLTLDFRGPPGQEDFVFALRYEPES